MQVFTSHLRVVMVGWWRVGMDVVLIHTSIMSIMLKTGQILGQPWEKTLSVHLMGMLQRQDLLRLVMETMSTSSRKSVMHSSSFVSPTFRQLLFQKVIALSQGRRSSERSGLQETQQVPMRIVFCLILPLAETTYHLIFLDHVIKWRLGSRVFWLTVV